MNAKDRGVSTEIEPALDAEGPLRRWARRKREVARKEQAAAEAHRENTSAGAPDARRGAGMPGAHEPDGEALVAVVEEKILTDEDMPPLDSLDEGSDYSGFLSPGVSEGLRRRALRKLFMSAVFNVPDGLDDYDEDFTSFQALGDIVTSDMKHQAEMEAERAKQAQARSDTASGIDDEPGDTGERPPAQVDREAADGADGEAANLAQEEVAERAESSGSGPPALVSAEHVSPDSIEGDRAPPDVGAAPASDGEAAGPPALVADGRVSPGAGMPAPGSEADRRRT